MPRARTFRDACALLLLFAVAWGQVWASAPHATLHHHAEGGHAAAEVELCGIDIPVSGIDDRHPATEAQDVAGEGKHQHHFHVCSLGGNAMVSETQLQLAAAKAILHASLIATHAIRSPEQLLRPPID